MQQLGQCNSDTNIGYSFEYGCINTLSSTTLIETFHEETIECNGIQPYLSLDTTNDFGDCSDISNNCNIYKVTHKQYYLSCGCGGNPDESFVWYITDKSINTGQCILKSINSDGSSLYLLYLFDEINGLTTKYYSNPTCSGNPDSIFEKTPSCNMLLVKECHLNGFIN